MMLSVKAFSAALLVALVGCASQGRLTVETEPAGGYISEQGSGLTVGMAPAVIVYDPVALGRFKDAAGCYRVKGVEARWVSGAVSRSEPSIRLCGPSNGSYTYRLVRNPNHPDLSKDLQFAVQLSNAAARNAQAAAASTAAAAALLQAARPAPVQSIVGPTIQTGIMGFLKREYTSGMNKICVYDKAGSEFAITVSSVSLCPQTVQ